MKNLIFIFTLFVIYGLSFADESKWEIGPHLRFSFAKSDHVYGQTTGEGLGTKVLYDLKKFDNIRIRGDLIYLSYGETRTSLQNTFYIKKTRHESFQLNTGFQWDIGSGNIRSYVAPMVGVYNYRSVSSIPDAYYYEMYYYGYPVSDTRDVQWTYGMRLEGGLLFDIGLGALIDVGLNYQKIFNLKVKGEENSYQTHADDIMVNVGVLIPISD